MPLSWYVHLHVPLFIPVSLCDARATIDLIFLCQKELFVLHVLMTVLFFPPPLCPACDHGTHTPSASSGYDPRHLR